MGTNIITGLIMVILIEEERKKETDPEKDLEKYLEPELPADRGEIRIEKTIKGHPLIPDSIVKKR